MQHSLPHSLHHSTQLADHAESRSTHSTVEANIHQVGRTRLIAVLRRKEMVMERKFDGQGQVDQRAC